MPEVWTHDNLSKHFMPRSNTVFQLFILLCCIVSFMFLFNWRCKITDFLEDQQISLEKSRHKANCWAHSAKVQVQIDMHLHFSATVGRQLVTHLRPVFLALVSKVTTVIQRTFKTKWARDNTEPRPKDFLYFAPLKDSKYIIPLLNAVSISVH